MYDNTRRVKKSRKEDNNMEIKRLIIYHTYATHTRMVAKMIQEKLNCDILELKPKIPFSSDYQSVVDEYQNNSIKDKEIQIEEINVDLDDYQEIILGTPVWWYTMTPVIASFLKKYDLSGKIIYPFATNAGWIGHTFQDIKKLCNSSVVKNGLNVLFTTKHVENKMLTKEQEIDEWINKEIKKKSGISRNIIQT